MTTTKDSPAGQLCVHCHHLLDNHVFAALPVDHPAPMGVMLCREPGGCECTTTWRAGTRASTPQEIHETRALVREALARLELPIPPHMR